MASILHVDHKDTLLNIFQGMKPKATANIQAGNSLETHGLAFVNKVQTNKAKSELAHRLAIELEKNETLQGTFIIPEYIQQAIRWVIKGE